MNRFCFVSHQIDEHADVEGRLLMHELEIEKRRKDKLKMALRLLKITGRRAARIGFKPLMDSKAYLDGYAKQYAREFMGF